MDTIFDVLSRPTAALAVDVAAKSTLVLAAAGVAALALRRAPAATRHLAWCLGPCGAWPCRSWPSACRAGPGRSCRMDDLAASETRQAVATVPAEVVARAATSEQHARAMIAATSSDEPPSRETGPDGIATGPSPMTTARTWAPSPSTWLAAAWSALMMLFLAVPMVGRFALWRLAAGARPIEEGEWIALLARPLRRLGLSRRVTLLRSRHALMPMTWGWLRPVVLLPADADSWPVEPSPGRPPPRAGPYQATGLPDPGPRPGGLCVCTGSTRSPGSRRIACASSASTPATTWCCSPVPGRPITPSISWTSPGRSDRGIVIRSPALAMARPSHLEGRLLSILDAGCPRRGLTPPVGRARPDRAGGPRPPVIASYDRASGPRRPVTAAREGRGSGRAARTVAGRVHRRAGQADPRRPAGRPGRPEEASRRPGGGPSQSAHGHGLGRRRRPIPGRVPDDPGGATGGPAT